MPISKLRHPVLKLEFILAPNKNQRARRKRRGKLRKIKKVHKRALVLLTFILAVRTSSSRSSLTKEITCGAAVTCASFNACHHAQLHIL
jgi:hypothetical protein